MTRDPAPLTPTSAADSAAWVAPDDLLLLVDRYELSMVEAQLEEGLLEPAVFSLFTRRLPESRNYLLACGLDTVLGCLESLRATPATLEYLEDAGFGPRLIEWLRDFRFTGDVRAVPEGTPIFRNEPILEIEAPFPQAQLVETIVMNQMHLQSVLASKASRVRQAAGARRVIDFGLRRMHGADAGLKGARAYHIAGLDGTSNELAGRRWGVPVTGTMAHAWIQAHDDELEAFRSFVATHPATVLLVDTFDTLEGVRNVVRLAGELGDDFRVRGIRLDSGDLATLARASREILDDAGLAAVEIFASGGLDEWKIRELIRADAPIDGFGVGTAMGVSADAPSLDLVYKLVARAGSVRMKLSSEKTTLPGRKQVFRRVEGGEAVGDVIGRAAERGIGRPLLRPVMRGGERLAAGEESLETIRRRVRDELSILPPPLLDLDPADPPYPVEISPALAHLRDEVRAELEHQVRG
ncbi:MAG: nicotinate phosphoribosyltransferase [Longimicrobiales bacterium]|nr:nicotinate phosphoribosyltransferase [Longimicrobiales bacterium]